MAYFRPSQERALVTKRFLTAREVEDMAAAGAVEIMQVDGLVITDAARETAHDLGLRIRQPERQPQPEGRASPREPDAPRAEPGVSPAPVPMPVAPVAPIRVTAAGGASDAPRSRDVTSDPLTRAVVQAVRANRSALAAIAEGT
jgi:hypothetical protein